MPWKQNKFYESCEEKNTEQGGVGWKKSDKEERDGPLS